MAALNTQTVLAQKSSDQLCPGLGAAEYEYEFVCTETSLFRLHGPLFADSQLSQVRVV